jgi:hypothetical protein
MLFFQVSLIRGLKIDALPYIYQPLPPLDIIDHNPSSVRKSETLIILRPPPYSMAWLDRLDLEGGKLRLDS